MNRRTLLQSIPAAALLPAALAHAAQAAPAASGVYELRIYHTFPGKFDDLLARFRNHTLRIFEKHNMRSIAYWLPLDEPLKGTTLYYVLGHPSREAATANWKAFGDDPEWVTVRTASEANGKLVERVESTFLELADFSPHI